MKNCQYYNKIVENKLFCGAEQQNILDCLECSDCEVKTFDSGEAIDIRGKLAFVLKGAVRIYSRDKQRNLLLRRAEKNELFGLAGLFSKEKTISRAFAKGSATILFFGGDCIKQLIEKDRAVMYNYLSFLSDRIDYLNKKITYITAGSAERKLATFFASFEKAEFELPVSFSSLSDMLDIGRASLYRALDKLVSDGCIERDGNDIKIINKALMLEKY